MPANDQPIRVQLTPEQKEKIRALTGQDVDALEFTAEQLEERVTPVRGVNLN